ncbi:hypothetical protein AC792_15755 [Arthrobacter sp. RIT-PI-e]|uniref:hypothetical protein n=1 Tax=Arthrobacter sp. RIT-PI-e TaxID=1681197 RepID=UPI000676852F|nr:hypothetical protein [Arthrobacter sp. RIT-PI-e]KNC13465.1 hypothetical protein AC792_15755 [Arthrobacter sp. RIT-PI-e]
MEKSTPRSLHLTSSRFLLDDVVLEPATIRIRPVADDHGPRTTYGGSMSRKNTALSIATNPRSQALAGGALSLIPGRTYPGWLRHTITWGSTATVVALIAVPQFRSEVLERTSGQKTPPAVEMSPKARAGFAAVTGALMYGTWRFGWWFDEAAEQALRRMRVPFPRVVLGAAVGAWYYYADARGRRKAAARDTADDLET